MINRPCLLVVRVPKLILANDAGGIGLLLICLHCISFCKITDMHGIHFLIMGKEMEGIKSITHTKHAHVRMHFL